MIKFKTATCILLAGLALILFGCSPALDVPVRNWKMSVVTNKDSSWAKGARLFADLVRQRSGGRIQITVYPNGELAGGNQVKELAMLQDAKLPGSR